MGWRREVFNNVVAVVVFLLFFTVVFLSFFLIGTVSVKLVWVGILAVMLLMAYSVLSRMGLFGTREKPERILNKKLRFKDADWIQGTPPDVVVKEFSDMSYTAYFVEPFVVKGREAKAVYLSPRWVGCPISGAKRWRIVPANATLDTGDGFIAMVHIVSYR